LTQATPEEQKELWRVLDRPTLILESFSMFPCNPRKRACSAGLRAHKKMDELVFCPSRGLYTRREAVNSGAGRASFGRGGCCNSRREAAFGQRVSSRWDERKQSYSESYEAGQAA
jgi:hypothetical protein